MRAMRGADRGVFLSTLVAVLVIAGCASSSNAPPGVAGGGTSSTRDVITTEELSGIFVADLYQAIERLRPHWLTSRGLRSVTGETIIAVVVDGNFLGGVEMLRQITTPTAIRIRYMDASEATATIAGITGSGRVVEGAIIVELGRDSRGR